MLAQTKFVDPDDPVFPQELKPRLASAITNTTLDFCLTIIHLELQSRICCLLIDRS
jgi:hypothetical protein